MPSSQMDSSKDNKKRWTKYTSLIGCCILLLPNGFFWYWGNMAVYCKSYLVSAMDSHAGVDSSWVLSTFVVMWTISVAFSDRLANRAGRRCTVLAGILIFDTGVFCGYFAVQNSLFALAFTSGFMGGVGTGLIDSYALQLGIDWSDKSEVGRFTAIVQGFLSIGALLINQIVTLYVNPSNGSPDFAYSLTKYFSQRRILDKVPTMFFVVGCFSLAAHVIGFLMVKQKSHFERNDVQVAGLSSEKTPVNGLAQYDDVSETNANVSSNSEDSKNDYTCKQMLKTKSFYTLWGIFFIFALTFVLGSNYYKMFGQIWIKDDHFMADLATVMSLVSGVMSAFMGFAIDAYGVKNCQVVIILSTALVLFWYYFTAMANRWLYFLAALLLMSLAGPTFSCYTAAITILYGKTHFTTNFGVMMTAQLSFHLLSLLVIGRALTYFGWFVTYTGTGTVVLLCLIPCALFIPNI